MARASSATQPAPNWVILVWSGAELVVKLMAVWIQVAKVVRAGSMAKCSIVKSSVVCAVAGVSGAPSNKE